MKNILCSPVENFDNNAYFQSFDADVIENDFDNVDPFGDIPEEDNNKGHYDDIDLEY